MCEPRKTKPRRDGATRAAAVVVAAGFFLCFRRAMEGEEWEDDDGRGQAEEWREIRVLRIFYHNTNHYIDEFDFQ